MQDTEIVDGREGGIMALNRRMLEATGAKSSSSMDSLRQLGIDPRGMMRAPDREFTSGERNRAQLSNAMEMARQYRDDLLEGRRSDINPWAVGPALVEGVATRMLGQTVGATVGAVAEQVSALGAFPGDVSNWISRQLTGKTTGELADSAWASTIGGDAPGAFRMLFGKNMTREASMDDLFSNRIRALPPDASDSEISAAIGEYDMMSVPGVARAIGTAGTQLATAVALTAVAPATGGATAPVAAAKAGSAVARLMAPMKMLWGSPGGRAYMAYMGGTQGIRQSNQYVRFNEREREGVAAWNDAVERLGLQDALGTLEAPDYSQAMDLTVSVLGGLTAASSELIGTGLSIGAARTIGSRLFGTLKGKPIKGGMAAVLKEGGKRGLLAGGVEGLEEMVDGYGQALITGMYDWTEEGGLAWAKRTGQPFDPIKVLRNEAPELLYDFGIAFAVTFPLGFGGGVASVRRRQQLHDAYTKALLRDRLSMEETGRNPGVADLFAARLISEVTQSTDASRDLLASVIESLQETMPEIGSVTEAQLSDPQWVAQFVRNFPILAVRLSELDGLSRANLEWLTGSAARNRVPGSAARGRFLENLRSEVRAMVPEYMASWYDRSAAELRSWQQKLNEIGDSTEVEAVAQRTMAYSRIKFITDVRAKIQDAWLNKEAISQETFQSWMNLTEAVEAIDTTGTADARETSPATARTASPEVLALLPRAREGDADAAVELSARYERGDGVPQDFLKSQYWFNVALAAKDDVDALVYLGKFYEGRVGSYPARAGKPRSIDKARALYRKAYEMGSDEAGALLTQIGGTLPQAPQPRMGVQPGRRSIEAPRMSEPASAPISEPVSAPISEPAAPRQAAVAPQPQAQPQGEPPTMRGVRSVVEWNRQRMEAERQAESQRQADAVEQERLRIQSEVQRQTGDDSLIVRMLAAESEAEKKLAKAAERLGRNLQFISILSEQQGDGRRRRSWSGITGFVGSDANTIYVVRVPRVGNAGVELRHYMAVLLHENAHGVIQDADPETLRRVDALLSNELLGQIASRYDLGRSDSVRLEEIRVHTLTLGLQDTAAVEAILLAETGLDKVKARLKLLFSRAKILLTANERAALLQKMLQDQVRLAKEAKAAQQAKPVAEPKQAAVEAPAPAAPVETVAAAPAPVRKPPAKRKPKAEPVVVAEGYESANAYAINATLQDGVNVEVMAGGSPVVLTQSSASQGKLIVERKGKVLLLDGKSVSEVTGYRAQVSPVRGKAQPKQAAPEPAAQVQPVADDLPRPRRGRGKKGDGQQAMFMRELSAVESVASDLRLKAATLQVKMLGAKPELKAELSKQIESIKGEFRDKVGVPWDTKLPAEIAQEQDSLQFRAEQEAQRERKAEQDRRRAQSVVESHQKAHARGDDKAARRLADRAAKANGYVVAAKHGTNVEFTAFEAGEFGFHFGDASAAGQRGDSKDFYLRIENPMRIKDMGYFDPMSFLNGNTPEARRAREETKRLQDLYANDLKSDDSFVQRRATYLVAAPAREYLKRQGYDGLVYRNEAEGFGDSYVAFDANQIKSADPFTYDNNGNLIPLDKRFDDSTPDVRFMREAVPVAQMRSWLEGMKPPSDKMDQMATNWLWEYSVLDKSIKALRRQINLPDDLDAAELFQIAPGKRFVLITDLVTQEVNPMHRIADALAASEKMSRAKVMDLVQEYAFVVHAQDVMRLFEGRVDEATLDKIAERAKAAAMELDTDPNALIDLMVDQITSLGIRMEDAVARQAELEAQFAADPSWMDLVQRLRDINRKTMDMRLEAGLVTQAAYDTVLERYPNYVPVVRSLFSPEVSDTKAEKTGNQRAKALRLMKGPSLAAKEDLRSFWAGSFALAQYDRMQVANQVPINRADNALFRLGLGEDVRLLNSETGEMVSPENRGMPLVTPFFVAEHMRAVAKAANQRFKPPEQLEGETDAKYRTRVEVARAESVQKAIGRAQEAIQTRQQGEDADLRRLKLEEDLDRTPGGREAALAAAKDAEEAGDAKEAARIRATIKVLPKGTQVHYQINDPVLARAMLVRRETALEAARGSEDRAVVRNLAANWLRLMGFQRFAFVIASPNFLKGELMRSPQQVAIMASVLADEYRLSPEQSQRFLEEIDRRLGGALGGTTVWPLMPIFGAARAIPWGSKWRSAKHVLQGGTPRNEYESMIRQAMEDGVMQGALYDVGTFEGQRKKVIADLKKLDSAKTNEAMAKVVQAGVDVTQWFDVMTNAVDFVNRMVMYEAAIAAGLSRQKAAVMARDSTVDFGKKGVKARAASQFYLFLSPRMQGIHQLIRAFQSSTGDGLKASRRVLGKYFLWTLVVSLLREFLFEDDEDPQTLTSKFAQEQSMLLPLPWYEKDGRWTWLQINNPYGFGAIAKMSNAIAEMLAGDIGPAEALATSASSFVSELAPVTIENKLRLGSWAQAFVPTNLQPIADVIFGRDYKGSPIAPLGAQFGAGDLRASRRYFANTPYPYIWASHTLADLTAPIYRMAMGPGVRGLELSPNEIQYVLERYMPGIVRNAIDGVSVIGQQMEGTRRGIDQIPILSSTIAQSGGRRVLPGLFRDYDAIARIVREDLRTDPPADVRARHGDLGMWLARSETWKQANARLKKLQEGRNKAIERGDRVRAQLIEDRIMEVRRNAVAAAMRVETRVAGGIGLDTRTRRAAFGRAMGGAN